MRSNDEYSAVKEWQSRAKVELFHLYFTRWRIAIGGAIALIAVVGGIFMYLTQNTALWWWIALQTCAYLLQAAWCLRYEEIIPQIEVREFWRWMWIWTLQTALAGFISGALIFWIPADQLGLQLAAIMVSGTFAIGEACASGHERLVFAAVISQALMACIALIVHVQMPLAVIVCVLFAAVVLQLGWELNRAMLGEIMQRFHAEQLATQLEQRQQDLLEAQHQQSVLRERQRMIYDMHDGLGSTLLSTLVAIEHRQMPQQAVAEALRSCVEDLRLLIDSLEPVEHDLVTVLATIRYRLGQRLDAAGLTLEWDIHDLPPLPWLESPDALHFLRLVQEALANVLKHAQASRVKVTTRHLGEQVEIGIEDDGCGFDLAEIKPGRGFGSQHRRAQRLGGELTVESVPGNGTSLLLRLPVMRA